MHPLRTTALLLGLLGLVPAAAGTSYSVVCGAQPCGSLELEREGNRGSARLSYRNNGRGPDLDERFELDAAGQLQHYRVQGKATFGAVIDELYERRGADALWRSTIDQGERRDAAAELLYLPTAFTPAWTAELARQLLARGGRPGVLLPSGQLRAEKLLVHSLPEAGPQPARRIALVRLQGADLVPAYVWLHEDGHELFAQVWSGFGGVVPQGDEAELGALDTIQQQAERTRLERLAATLPRPLPGLTLIANVRWFDARQRRLRGPADIYLHQGQITQLRAPGPALPGVRQRIDGGGRVLLPGLFDMHVHAGGSANGLLNLAAGVTSVREMGGNNARLGLLQQELASGLRLGPRMVMTGFIEGESPHANRGKGLLARDLDEALAHVDAYAARGYRQLKLYNSIKPEWVKPIAERAHALGLKVGGHVPAFMTAQQAIRLGFDEIHHINQLTLNFLVQAGDDTRTLLRFELVADRAHELRLNEPRVRRFVAELRRRGTVVDPTLAIFEEMFMLRAGRPSPNYGMVAEHLPPALQRRLLIPAMKVNDDNQARYRASTRFMVELVGRMHQAGVRLVAGTDDLAGFTLQRELELYVQAGIAPAEVLHLATLGAAEIAGVAASTGSIEAGKQADLLLVDGDPTRRISDIRKAVLVIQGDRAFEPDRLYESLGVRAFRPAARIETLPQASAW